MYYVIITDDKINGVGECECTGDNTFSIEITEEVYNNIDKYIYSNGEIIVNPNYEQEEAERQKQEQKQRLIEEIDELDKKRIRAICEPSEKEPGLTWLEYYNGQIANLREQLKNL